MGLSCLYDTAESFNPQDSSYAELVCSAAPQGPGSTLHVQAAQPLSPADSQTPGHPAHS